MLRFIIKETSIATDKNPSFAGETAICYSGKAGECVGYDGNHDQMYYRFWDEDNKVWSRRGLDKGKIREYGYKRLCDAKKAFIYRNPENSDFWHSTVEIIKLEV